MDIEKSPPRIGFIGQGYIGKNYADDFENRGYTVIRYALEEPYRDNKEKIASCDIVFIAVPTPTTPEGFDDHIVREAVALVGKGKIAVIKSTVLPGTTASIQKQYPEVHVLHSPEFLSEATAAHDAAHPARNIVGFTVDTQDQHAKAYEVLAVLPKGPFELVCTADEAEFIKYAHNIHGYLRVVYANILYDLSHKININFNVVGKAMNADPMMSPWYNNPLHKSGRGAGGHCFIKDMAAFRSFYENINSEDISGLAFLKQLESKNIELLKQSGKDLDLLKGVYGI